MNRLKKLRLEHGLTLDDIEAKTGIKRGTYNNYENEVTEPTLKTWQKMADFFGVSVAYLQGRYDHLTKKEAFSIIHEIMAAQGITKKDIETALKEEV